MMKDAACWVMLRQFNRFLMNHVLSWPDLSSHVESCYPESYGVIFCVILRLLKTNLVLLRMGIFCEHPPISNYIQVSLFKYNPQTFKFKPLISRNDVKSGVKTTTSVTFPLFSTSYDTAENRLGDDTNIGRHILVLGI